MPRTKQCCICRAVYKGRSTVTGQEIWRPTTSWLYATHGVCPECMPLEVAKARRAAASHRAVAAA